MGARTMTMEEANRIAQQRIAELEEEVERLEKEKERWRDIAYNCGYIGEGEQDG